MITVLQIKFSFIQNNIYVKEDLKSNFAEQYILSFPKSDGVKYLNLNWFLEIYRFENIVILVACWGNKNVCKNNNLVEQLIIQGVKKPHAHYMWLNQLLTEEFIANGVVTQPL